ncbi:ubiquinol-cytochrome-c reductase complex assembly factor 3-like [Anneissia japonica]|uniref:ubiquinol-cytochrome-c reductase complex assembly factor 3-like n=1 Tax=Anneissia japonica TaxID=1529436 RepID=UPI0014258C7A|nr:ubiquinol-cytochrome-c reductase complex assembly factor 3-like [Anneissia japonica]
MSVLVKTLTVGGWVGVFSVLGWSLMKFVTPSREDMLKVLPEQNPEYMTESRKRSQDFLDVIKAAAETDKAIHYRDNFEDLKASLKKD